VPALLVGEDMLGVVLTYDQPGDGCDEVSLPHRYTDARVAIHNTRLYAGAA
jgi:hypothetical protein